MAIIVDCRENAGQERTGWSRLDGTYMALLLVGHSVRRKWLAYIYSVVQRHRYFLFTKQQQGDPS